MQGYHQEGANKVSARMHLSTIERMQREYTIQEKTDLQQKALEYASCALEEAGVYQDAAILRYHAINRLAVMYCREEHIRKALERSTQVIKGIIYMEASSNGTDSETEHV